MENEQEKQTRKKWYLHWAFLLSVLLLIALVWVFLSKQSQIKQLKQNQKEQISGLKQNFSEFTQTTEKDHFKLMTKPFSWLVRKELLAENLDPVNNYFNIMIREDEIQEIFLADPQGKIIISTNKKFEDKRFSKFYKEDYLEVQEIHSWRDDDMLLISSPIFGYEKRLGTIFIKIKPQKFQTPKK